MSLAAIAIEKKVVTYFATFLIIVGGIAAFFSLGQLEDPEFSIKTAVVTTAYPGASPEEVELEVTDRIELALQELPELDYLESYSRAGFSLIKVNIKSEYWSDQLPQIWDTVRRKVRDVEEILPPGAGRPDVGDDFGDVFGFQLAITGDGFSYAELERYAKDLKKDLSLVDGVARVDLWGVQQKVIYLDVSQTQLTQLGFSDTSLEQTLQQQNVVVDAGNVNVQDQRLRIAPTGQFQSPQDIGQLTLRPSLLDSLQNPSAEGGLNRATELIRIRDIGTVRPGYLDPPFTLMRFNGLPALGISITNASGVNIVDVGRRIDARLADLVQLLPIGIEVQRVHWQSDIVDEAVNNFLLSFAEAVGIVLVVLAIFMGWRLGLIIGTALVVTILGSFMLMAAFGIDLQRMSLGALVIAADGVTKGFGEDLLIEDLSFKIPPGAIVGIIGPNGAGKTTLFRMITGQEQPDAGTLRVGDTVKLGYVDQSRDSLGADKTVWEEISNGDDVIELGKRSMPSRAYVSAFNFRGPDQQKKVGQLSGGERNRVHLAKMLKSGANVVLLDEPTNDLDVDTLRALEEAMLDFAGCALIISHDRWFLDRIATHILAFEGDSHVEWFEGNYQEYEAERHKRLGTDADQPHRIKFKKFSR